MVQLDLNVTEHGLLMDYIGSAGGIVCIQFP